MTTQAQENNTSTLLPVAYMAPESIRKQEYSIKSDSFSFGVFLWEIVTRYETETPHPQNNAWVWSADQAFLSQFIY
jgi:serine/threonine protein kinase